MRHLLVLFIAAAFAVSGCNKQRDDDTLEAISQAEQAQESLGEEEIFARDKIAELTQVIQDGIQESAEVDRDVEQWLHAHKDALTQNARALEAKLQQKDDAERAYYEETFSVFMRPTLEEWNETLEALKSHDRKQFSYVSRVLQTVMSSKSTSKTEDVPAPEQAPEVGDELE